MLVHCAQGVHRSATFVAAYLMKEQKLSYEKAESILRQLRPVVHLDRFSDQLRLWVEVGFRLDERTRRYQRCRIGRDKDVVPEWVARVMEETQDPKKDEQEDAKEKKEETLRGYDNTIKEHSTEEKEN